MKSNRTKSWLKWIVTTCSVLLVVAAILIGFPYFFGDEEQVIIRRSTSTVQKGNLEVNVSGSGSIKPAAKESIKATVEAVVEKINFQEGDLVKKGDVLITFEQKDISTQLNSAQLSLEGKLLDLEDMQNKYKSVDDTSRDSMKISIKKLELDIKSARQSIETMQEDVVIDPVVSPIDGKLTTLDVKVGETPTRNAVIAEVVDYANLQIIIAIDELDIPKVAIGQQSTISVESLPDSMFTGEVIAIAEEGTTSNGVATFDVTVQLKEGTGIKSGMSAEASILVESKENTLYLPIEAVQSLRGRYYVTLPTATTSTDGTEETATERAIDVDMPSGRNIPEGMPAADDLPEGMRPMPEGGFPQRDGSGTGAVRNGAQGNAQGFAGQGGTARSNAGIAQGGNSTMKFIEVGIHNEDYIEVLSGLSEGDVVVLPMTVGTTTTNEQTQGGFGGGGFGGVTGVAPSGGGFGGNGGPPSRGFGGDTR